MRTKQTWAGAALPLAVVTLLFALSAAGTLNRTVRLPNNGLRQVASINRRGPGR